MHTKDPGGQDRQQHRVPVLGRGAIVGRYLVVGLVGTGGMGEVYAAYDPELDRKIALKLLRAQSTAGSDASEGRARLLREAQAIARLSDANVVTVYDVGTFDDRVFLAMEFVDGNTLGYWLEAKNRSWREVVAVFASAGRGLAAAHRAGVIHRDFKPDNVMIGSDGKVRVMDFGLARTIAPPAVDDLGTAAPEARKVDSGDPRMVVTPPGPPASASALPAPPGALPGHTSPRTPSLAPAATTAVLTGDLSDVDDVSTRDLAAVLPPRQSAVIASPLTVTGAMMGTPAYMAPEQFQAGTLDARTDQFSFCAALYEALYKERPFPGQSIPELSANVCAGRLRPPPANARVPGWLRRVLLRGLRVNSGERHPSMETLLDALTRDPTRSRRRALLGVSLVALVAVMGLGLVRNQQHQRLRCLGSEAKLAGIWELPGPDGRLPPRKEAVRRAFLATGKRYAADSFNIAMSALDRYVTAWTEMHREACEATNTRGEQSSEVLDLRMGCLNDRLSDVRALTNVFSGADAEVVAQSVKAAQGLRSIEGCADVAALKAVVRPPDDPAVSRAVAEVRTQLADVKALTNAGRFQDGAKVIEQVVRAARATNYEAVVAEALLLSAEIQDFDNPKMAETTYEQAMWAAEASHHDEVVVEAADSLVGNLANFQDRPRDAFRWAAFAEARLKRLGPGHDILAAWRQNNLAIAYLADGKLPQALALFNKAVQTKVGVLGENNFDVAISLGNAADASAEMGRPDEAIIRELSGVDDSPGHRRFRAPDLCVHSLQSRRVHAAEAAVPRRRDHGRAGARHPGKGTVAAASGSGGPPAGPWVGEDGIGRCGSRHSPAGTSAGHSERRRIVESAAGGRALETGQGAGTEPSRSRPGHVPRRTSTPGFSRSEDEGHPTRGSGGLDRQARGEPAAAQHALNGVSLNLNRNPGRVPHLPRSLRQAKPGFYLIGTLGGFRTSRAHSARQSLASFGLG